MSWMLDRYKLGLDFAKGWKHCQLDKTPISFLAYQPWSNVSYGIVQPILTGVIPIEKLLK